MLSFTQQQTNFGDLSQNTSASNLARGAYLANVEHRYLLQKYFNNEGSYSISTIGNNTLTVTSAPQVNDASATLSVVWNYPTCTTVVTFSDGEVQNVLFTNGSTAITWPVKLTGTQFFTTATIPSGATSATLASAWSTATQSSLTVFSDGSTKTVTYTLNSSTISWSGGVSQNLLAYVNTSVCTTSIGVGGVQFYRMPPNYSKLKDVTLTIGNLKWTMEEVRTRKEWDELNVFPYYASIPSRFFIYPGGDHGSMLGIWPIPSNTGNIITFNYKFRVPDLAIADYTTGNVSVSNGGTTVTGSGTSWTVTTNPQLESRWIQFAPTSSSSTAGDNLWYQVASVDSATSLTLYQPYQGTSITTSTSYTLGQMPLLPEDFQDMLLWRPLQQYFMTIVDNPNKAKEFEGMYEQKKELLAEYSGSNTINVNLSPRPQQKNPNQFIYNTIGK